MVICIVALVVFGILGIFSARYRRLAKDAFTCVARSIVFKPCNTRLDQKIKATVTAKLMSMSKALARFFYKNFRLISWIFTIAFFASMYFTAVALYNWVVYGTCEPGTPASSCPLNRAQSILTCNAAKTAYVIIIIVAALVLVYYYVIRKRTRRGSVTR